MCAKHPCRSVVCLCAHIRNIQTLVCSRVVERLYLLGSPRSNQYLEVGGRGSGMRIPDRLNPGGCAQIVTAAWLIELGICIEFNHFIGPLQQTLSLLITLTLILPCYLRQLIKNARIKRK